MRTKKIIGVAFGYGAQVQDTCLGPQSLKEAMGHPLFNASNRLEWDTVLHPKQSDAHEPHHKMPYALQLEHVRYMNEVLANRLIDMDYTQDMPIIVGGDHSIAIGTWTGVAHATHTTNALGLIWVDAHMDANTPSTSPSKAIHGMPVAVLLGQGESALMPARFKHPVLNPKHLVLMGIRSFESGEKALLERLGVKVIYMEDINQKGFNTCWQEAIEYVKQQTQNYGISVDLDGLDPQEVPGVGSPEANGILPSELLSGIQQLKGDPKLIAIELAEYNPRLDKEQKTQTVLLNILREVSKI